MSSSTNNLNIIGFPKSGTSSLFYWLDAHPQLQGSNPKETFFFMDQSHPLCGRHGLNFHKDGISAYSNFFDPPANERIRFEGTTHYFYQTTAIEQFAKTIPDTFIVILLREPAERIYSSFRFTRDNLAICDRTLTFNQYAQALLEGKTEGLRHLYKDPASHYIASRELEFNKYVEWLNWWHRHISVARIQIILFEQLQKDPHHVINNLCRRLNIDDNYFQQNLLTPKNQTYQVGKQSIHRLARKIARFFPESKVRYQLKSNYLNWQKSKASFDQDYEWGLAQLRHYFTPWNSTLENHYNLNLAHWWGTRSLEAPPR